MTFWAHLWNRIRAVPAGLWAALAVAGSLFALYLKGRRLEAELAKAKLQTETAKAAAVGARAQGRAETHLKRADEHAAKAALIEIQLEEIRAVGASDQKKLNAMPPSAVTAEYLKRLREKKP
jgi:hypothetical protein